MDTNEVNKAISYNEPDGKNNETKVFWLFVAITVAAIITNALYAKFIGYHPSWWIITIDYVSNFTDSVLALFIASKILFIQGSFYKTIGVSVLFYIMYILVQPLGLSLAFLSIGIFVIGALFILLMRIYDIGFLKALLLIILQTIVILIINYTMLGIYKLL
jgi:hypothetical protein